MLGLFQVLGLRHQKIVDPRKNSQNDTKKLPFGWGKNPANMQTNIVGLVLQYCPRAETLELMMVRSHNSQP